MHSSNPESKHAFTSRTHSIFNGEPSNDDAWKVTGDSRKI